MPPSRKHYCTVLLDRPERSRLLCILFFNFKIVHRHEDDEHAAAIAEYGIHDADEVAEAEQAAEEHAQSAQRGELIFMPGNARRFCRQHTNEGDEARKRRAEHGKQKQNAVNIAPHDAAALSKGEHRKLRIGGFRRGRDGNEHTSGYQQQNARTYRNAAYRGFFAFDIRAERRDHGDAAEHVIAGKAHRRDEPRAHERIAAAARLRQNKAV